MNWILKSNIGEDTRLYKPIHINIDITEWVKQTSIK